jgi:hypothetical protein
MSPTHPGHSAVRADPARRRRPVPLHVDSRVGRAPLPLGARPGGAHHVFHPSGPARSVSPGFPASVPLSGPWPQRSQAAFSEREILPPRLPSRAPRRSRTGRSAPALGVRERPGRRGWADHHPQAHALGSTRAVGTWAVPANAPHPLVTSTSETPPSPRKNPQKLLHIMRGPPLCRVPVEAGRFFLLNAMVSLACRSPTRHNHRPSKKASSLSGGR